METGLAWLACSFEIGWLLQSKYLSVVCEVATRGTLVQVHALKEPSSTENRNRETKPNQAFLL